MSGAESSTRPSSSPSPTELAALLQRDPASDDPELWGPTPGDRPAAVLVPLIRGDDGEYRILFTRRAEDLTKHAGEYSFPGGRPEPEDADLQATALRETFEEIGLTADLIEIVGVLPTTTTAVTGYAITPYVGIVEAPPRWVAQVTEVSEVVEPRLGDLVASREVRDYTRADGTTFRMPVFPLGPDRAIWGATARILDELLRRLGRVD